MNQVNKKIVEHIPIEFAKNIHSLPVKEINGEIILEGLDAIRVLEELSISEDAIIRSFVAFSENTTLEILKKLSVDKDCDVRRSVAANENTPAVILKKLSKDKDYSVRDAVAANVNTPEHLFDNLSKNAIIANSGIRNELKFASIVVLISLVFIAFFVLVV